jgi:hypothetical protein
MRLRSRYDTALTIHNTFDAALHISAQAHGSAYECFLQKSAAHAGVKTALEVEIEGVDAATTVNRAFARGLRTELLHWVVTADHLQHLLSRVVGVTNGPFGSLTDQLLELRSLLRSDIAAGKARLFALRSAALGASLRR